MIAHVSLPADNCAYVARVLAAMLDGGAMPFPPGGPDAWNAWARDNAFQIVVTPRGRFLIEGPTEQAWTPAVKDAPRASECHVAIATPRPAFQIVAIAEAAGWHARVCNRGGMFDLVEVWVENAYLVEVMDPDQLADYRRTMTVDNWRRAFGVSAGAPAGSAG